VRFDHTAIPGVVVVEPVSQPDERGFFARTFCRREFEAAGLSAEIVQSSVSYNRVRGTLRGMHFQAAPALEAKVVGCARGRIFDVALDVREGSPGYGRWVAFELSPADGRMLYVPEGVAHGFQSLEDDSVVTYQISEFYEPALSRGVRFDDAQVGIRWPLEPTVVSSRDRGLPTLAELAAAGALTPFRP
jgi:dTDP-4-dehydrorhamnose 3,5-epimerase